MKKAGSQHIAGKYYKKLANYGRDIPLAFDKEIIHNFRVSYKKVRAFFRLVNESGGKNKLKIPRQLKKLYKLTGELRDHQLQLGRGGEMANTSHARLPSYDSFLDKKISGIKSQILTLLREDPVNHYIKTTPSPPGFKLPLFTNYLQNKSGLVRKILAREPLTDEKLHQVRKILKDLFYNLEVYRLEHRFPTGTWKEKVEGYLDPLLDQMGDYQDRCTALSFLEIYWLAPLHSNDQGHVNTIIDEWKEEKTTWKKLLVNRLRQDPVLASGKVEAIPFVVAAIV